MKNSSQTKQTLVYMCVFTSLLIGMLFSATQCFAAAPPLQNVATAVVQVGTLKQLNFSIQDPVRGTVAGNSGAIDLGSTPSYGVSDGVVYWFFHQGNSGRVGFSVYDPRIGSWVNKTSDGFSNDTDVFSSSILCKGGVITWQGFHP